MFRDTHARGKQAACGITRSLTSDVLADRYFAWLYARTYYLHGTAASNRTGLQTGRRVGLVCTPVLYPGFGAAARKSQPLLLTNLEFFVSFVRDGSGDARVTSPPPSKVCSPPPPPPPASRLCLGQPDIGFLWLVAEDSEISEPMGRCLEARRSRCSEGGHLEEC